MVSVQGTSILRVINTPFLIVLDGANRAYYLKGGDDWFSSEKIDGPWQVTASVPEAIKSLEGPDSSAAKPAKGQEQVTPKIIVTTEPTELVVTDGEPELQTIENTGLLYVSNTESDVFVDMATQDKYLLIAGRWYTAKTKDGPWSFVSPEKLPADFAKIPPGHPKAGVLPFVSGTEEAKEAVLDAQIPQTAVIKKSDASCEVAYDGEPKFETVENTQIKYAVNTADPVFAVEAKYYCCSNGVWFEASAPKGPWTICTNVPGAIYTIPPSNPYYNVTYVRVYESTPNVV
jgi:hypothetical protein